VVGQCQLRVLEADGVRAIPLAIRLRRDEQAGSRLVLDAGDEVIGFDRRQIAIFRDRDDGYELGLLIVAAGGDADTHGR
jgi:hypothetical protein